MNLQALNRVCFTICSVCIVLGTLLSLSMIWVTYPNQFVWKSWLTIVVLFLASALTWSVSKKFSGRGEGGVSEGAGANR